MPSTSTKENAGRLKNFKNSGKDKDVGLLLVSTGLLIGNERRLVGNAKKKKRRYC